MKKFVSFAALAFLLIASPALALDLHGARSAGVIGERNDGYVAVLKSSPEAEALAAEVNAKRKREYARISKENGQTADVVGKLAAPQIIGGLPTGTRYQDASGNWQTR